MEKTEWFAIHVRRRFEKTTALRLQQLGIEHYLPVQLVTRRWSNSEHSMELPLLPGYVFCKVRGRIDESVLTIPGVLAVAGDAYVDNAISEQKIADFKRIVSTGLAVQTWPFTRTGKTVTMENGPLKGVTGVLGHTLDARVLIVSIHEIRRSIAVEVDYHHIFSSGAGVGTAA